ncbi:MAG: hypothetical protein HKN12_03535 [Gemmatimonadetes bacterium]|nr:hypothetical protein [Gemmatimonadota bacterium]
MSPPRDEERPVSEERVEELWEEIWPLLEAGKSEEAAAAALRAMAEVEDAPELHYLLGVSLMDMDQVSAAVRELERSVELADDWAESRSALAWAFFRNCLFDEAREQAARALDLKPTLSEIHQLEGLLAERAGDEDRALIAFAEARRLAPDRYPDPYKMDADEFLQIAKETVAELDDPIRRALDATGFFVQPVPADDLLTAEEPPLDPQLLGLFVGQSLLDQSLQDSGAMPNTLYLFQNNLERAATSRAELVEEIRITVLHEIGHHLGWDEDDLEERGLA